MTTQFPEKYLTARKALAAAHRVDEVKTIRDKAVAMEVYARQARDGDLIGLSVEIRKRAERRLGELMAEQRNAGTMARPPGGSKKHPRKDRVTKKPDQPSLAGQGIDKNLADRARKAAALSESKFEAQVAQSIRVAVAAVENERAIIKEARTEAQNEKRQRRADREAMLGLRQLAQPTRCYGVIYADPPWRFKSYSVETGMDRAADNHYPTMDLDAVKVIDIPAADDAVLFLWATVPMLPEALDVMRAWGFAYKSHFVWAKDKAGTGFWNRNKHELLLIGTRGSIPAPAHGEQFESLIAAPRGEHSAKPFCFREMIEEMFPTLPRIELFAREQFAGWSAWGNEIREIANENEHEESRDVQV